MEKENKYMLEVKEGKVNFIQSEEGALQPKLIPDPNIILNVNGKTLEEEVPVSPQDQIEIQFKEEVLSPAAAKITLSQDKMSAFLQIEPSSVKTFQLIDLAPSANLYLMTKELTHNENPLTKEEIMEQLKKHKVSYGIMEEAIDKVLEELPSQPTEIARGKPARPGKDARVEYLFKQEFQTAPSITPDGKVDYREILKIPYVKQGDTLVKKTPAREGEPGISVTGQELGIKPPRDIILKASKTTRLNSSERELRAVISGYPLVEEKGNAVIAHVSNIFTHTGDVDLSTGNLRFQGDIQIEGNVFEGMAIIAGGTVNISGDVNSAAVQSGNHLTVLHNVINSTLMAGGAEAILMQLQPVAHNLEENIKNLTVMVEALKKHPKFKGKELKGIALLKLIRALTQTKAPYIVEEVKKFSQLENQLSRHALSFNLPEELLQSIHKLANDLKLLFDSTSEKIVDCQILLTMLDYLQQSIKKHPAPESDISVGYTLKSCLETSGNIHITGQGCFQSEVIAGGEIQVAGILRGGSLMSGKNVFVKEVGSTAGVKSHISVPADCKINLNNVHENTYVTIGKQNYKFNMFQTNIEAYLYQGKVRLR